MQLQNAVMQLRRVCLASVCRTLHIITPVFATIGIANRGRLACGWVLILSVLNFLLTLFPSSLLQSPHLTTLVRLLTALIADHFLPLHSPFLTCGPFPNYSFSLAQERIQFPPNMSVDPVYLFFCLHSGIDPRVLFTLCRFLSEKNGSKWVFSPVCKVVEVIFRSGGLVLIQYPFLFLGLLSTTVLDPQPSE
ncbi:hypothetical protein K438DRAFT_751549 [Mycena galopus ATCC 62051]|nr:hypothetical protein K438DRAFT_751549 [Mycena galopus ATCC 62051]